MKLLFSWGGFLGFKANDQTSKKFFWVFRSDSNGSERSQIWKPIQSFARFRCGLGSIEPLICLCIYIFTYWLRMVDVFMCYCSPYLFLPERKLEGPGSSQSRVLMSQKGLHITQTTSSQSPFHKGAGWLLVPRRIPASFWVVTWSPPVGLFEQRATKNIGILIS